MSVRKAQISQSHDDYRSPMFATAFVDGFVGMLVMSGQWLFTVLANMARERAAALQAEDALMASVHPRSR